MWAMGMYFEKRVCNKELTIFFNLFYPVLFILDECISKWREDLDIWQKLQMKENI